MKKCRITVMRIARYDDLIKQYENPMEHPCDMELGQVFLANGWESLPAPVRAPRIHSPPLYWP